jgi:hypothetical protein
LIIIWLNHEFINNYLTTISTIHSWQCTIHRILRWTGVDGKVDLLSQSAAMSIIWLIKFVLLAFTLSVTMGLTNQTDQTARESVKRVEGLIVVAEAYPVIIYQK